MPILQVVVRRCVGLGSGVQSVGELLGVTGAAPVTTAVRWRYKPRVRKPLGLGRAPSKMYNIPKPPPQSEEEKAKLMALYENYRLHAASLQSFIKETQMAENRKTDVSDQGSSKVAEEGWESLLKVNQEWNQRVGASREARLAAHRLEEEARKQELAEALNRRIEKEAELARQTAEEMSTTVETGFNMDDMRSEIEKALDTPPIDCNFAITPLGQIVSQKEQKESQEASPTSDAAREASSGAA